MVPHYTLTKWIGLSFAILLAAVANATENAKEMVNIKVDFNSPAGKIRRLHGTNLSAPLHRLGYNGLDITQALKELDIPITRFHDAPLENPGLQLVDISRVFPLFHADPQDPENYYFDQTDDYLANCLATGAKMSYRLGESIEQNSKRMYFIHPPKDYDKWADICINVIRHYNEGWANGFRYNIEYWCIWEEPNNPTLFTGTWDDYIRLYMTTAKKIKQRFPQLKVGGPAIGIARGATLADKFLAECRQQNAPLDFFAWSDYEPSPSTIITRYELVKKLLNKHGFSKTELHMTEWNYFPLPNDWKKWKDDWKHRAWVTEEIGGINGAAFICAVLSGLQDTPIDMSYYYVCSTGDWGLFAWENGGRVKRKSYFGMKAFSMMTKYENRVSVQKLKNAEDVWVLAGRKENGQAAILVSCFKSTQRQIKLQLENYNFRPELCHVSILDAEHDLQPLDTVSISGSEITLSKPVGSAVFLVELL